jgi:putative SOS response-associated peptidase YedK
MELVPSKTKVAARGNVRSPVVIEQADWPVWLGEREGTPSRLLHPAAEEVLRLWSVSSAVGSPQNNEAALLDPVQDTLAARS